MLNNINISNLLIPLYLCDKLAIVLMRGVQTCVADNEENAETQTGANIGVLFGLFHSSRLLGAIRLERRINNKERAEKGPE